MPIPDFVIFLDKNEEALFELKKFNVPLIGIVDSDMNPHDFIYKFFGNNDSMESLEFFFEFLKETIQEGRLKEQQLFYSYFMFKIRKLSRLKRKH
jgi:ribosomal protein S2